MYPVNTTPDQPNALGSSVSLVADFVAVKHLPGLPVVDPYPLGQVVIDTLPKLTPQTATNNVPIAPCECVTAGGFAAADPLALDAAADVPQVIPDDKSPSHPDI